MEKETAEALEKSIQHWRENTLAKTPDDASAEGGDCALCKSFYDLGCQGCPVFASTGLDCCDGSPYEKAHDALTKWKSRPYIDRFGGNFHEAAQAELNFLISLRVEAKEDA